MIGVILLIFYFLNKKKIFSRYLIAMTLPIMISLPLWFFFPVNSPQNTYLNNVYQKEIEYSLLSPLENYQPSRHILEFHKKSGVMQGGTAPISTMPSMHVAWAIVIVYYLYQFKKRTIYFTLPWAFFSSLGTVYLAQHFFVDILVAIPIAISAIIITNYLVKIEKKYYQGGIYDNREKIFKEEIKDHFQQIWQKIYSFLPQKR
jgi:membrane-associated phospholipid phosphatase